MKKYFLLLTMGLMSLGLNNAFASDDVCPTVTEMRNIGSNFKFAYLDSGTDWQLASDAYIINGVTWQTLYNVSFNQVTSPTDAVITGQDFFNVSPLRTFPSASEFGDEVLCSYEPEGAIYTVTAVNSAVYGLRKFH